MKKTTTLQNANSARTEFKRKFNFCEMYRSFVYVPSAISKMSGNKKSKLIDEHFIERLQLAVTEVNGCAACSWAHTQMALRQGMSNEEISSFLSGGDTYIKTEEAKAILFAQHFADSRGFPERFAYDSIVKEYGTEEAEIILSAVQIMIVGNMYGIPLSALQSRLKGKPFKDSTLFYELGMLIAGFLSLPIAIVHGILRKLFGFSNKRFGESPINEEDIKK